MTMTKTKTNHDFITVRLIEYNGDNYYKGGSIAIRLDTITEVHAPKTQVVYFPKDEKESIWNAKSEKVKVAYILKSTGNGLGINGVSYGYYIDEDSYTRLTKALGIEEL